MKIISRIILSLLSVCIIILAVIVVLFMLNKHSNKVTYIGKYTSFINTGTSMDPVIKIGNLLIIKKEKHYLLNDIISFKNDEGIIITHRIIEINNDTYLTKGDSNNFTDGYSVSYEDIYGKVIVIMPGIKEISNYKYLILGIFIIIPIMFYALKKGQHVRTSNN